MDLRAPQLPSRRHRRVSALVLTIAAIAGACSAPQVAPDPQAVVTPPPVDRERLPRPEAHPEAVPDPTAPEECPVEVAAAMGVTVSAQLDAFADDDLDAAYALTSLAFQAAYSATEFEALIRSEYRELLGNLGHRLADCLVHDGTGLRVVGVRSATGELVLRYQLSESDGVWRIDGAGRLPGITLPPDTVV
jgi:hypothetical protein